MEKNLYKNCVVVCCFLLVFFISGCAPLISASMNAGVTDEVVVTKTADYFGVTQDEIEVSRIEKGTLATAYKTMYKGNLYNCSIYYGDVTCKVPGS